MSNKIESAESALITGALLIYILFFIVFLLSLPVLIIFRKILKIDK